MNVTFAYSRDEELLPLLPIINGEIKVKDIEFNFIKVKEDEIKFTYSKFDLYYMPLPLLNYVEAKILSNGAYIVPDLGLSENLPNEVCSSSNSTEYYLLKILTTSKAIPNSKPDCKGAKFMTSGYSFSLRRLWQEYCNDLPIVLSVIAGNLTDEEISKIKVIIRESAALQEKRGAISPLARELGLKGRRAIECFLDLCKKKNLCSKVSYVIL